MALRYVALGIVQFGTGSGRRIAGRPAVRRAGRRPGGRARGQSRGQRLHLGRPHPPRAAGARDAAPELASVLIGVNDVVQGVSTARYETNVVVILDALLERLPADRLFAVATPDYTVTPAGAEFGDPRQRHAAIVAANAVMADRRACAGSAGSTSSTCPGGPPRPEPGGERWAPPEWSPVRPVGRADRSRSWPSAARR